MYDRGAQYSVTDIARIAGANPRSVQHWAASGILMPKPETNRAGTGNRRVFAADEALIACVMQPLAERQTPVGELLRVALLIRDEFLARGAAERALLNTIISGKTQAWFVCFPEQDDPAAMIVQEGGNESFEAVFGQMQQKHVAIVVDLTAVFQGLRSDKI
ncbi:hypothetical protein AMST5_00124 [freshwater sediment metagenome]|uniref:HTH merR-type domain-containing protein n=1 Tax=freshwater sediment metagenome TaxID=556182 RepID=A0AA48RBJ7_9ZZZZ